MNQAIQLCEKIDIQSKQFQMHQIHSTHRQAYVALQTGK